MRGKVENSHPFPAIRKAKKSKHVRFDEDSEWIEISDDDVPGRLEEQDEEDDVIFAIEEDEYILI